MDPFIFCFVFSNTATDGLMRSSSCFMKVLQLTSGRSRSSFRRFLRAPRTLLYLPSPPRTDVPVADWRKSLFLERQPHEIISLAVERPSSSPLRRPARGSINEIEAITAIISHRLFSAGLVADVGAKGENI